MSRFEIPDWLHYACTACGRCCGRGYFIWCPPKDLPRLQAIDWGERFRELAGRRLFVSTPRGHRFAVDDNGACRFLAEDGRCRMHAALGYDQKVLTCKMYPFNLVHSFGRVHVGLLFSCPAVVDNQGPPVRKQTRLLERLLAEMDELFPPPPFAEETDFDGRRRIAFRSLRFFEDCLGAALADTSLPLVRRLLWAADIVDRLEATQSDALLPRTFHDTLTHHRDRAREEAENCGIRRPKLGRLERVLLRQFLGLGTPGAERHLTADAFWVRTLARLHGLGLGLRHIWGAGALPAGEARVFFRQVAQVQALHLAPESEELIGRYLSTRLASRAYCGQAGQDATVVAGARLTLLLAAAVLWQAKLRAAAEERDAVTHADVREGVIQTDKAFGHMAGLQLAPARRALGLVTRPGWPRKALLHTVVC